MITISPILNRFKNIKPIVFMKILKGLLFLFFISLAGSTNAQDIHFTQFYLSPLTTNPAYSGAFQGTVRLGGIYRDQWGSVISSPFRTPSFYVDAPLFMVGKKSWVGAGMMLYSDKAGALELATSQAMLSASIHMALDKKAKSVLSIGLQGGYTSRKIDLSQGVFQDAINSGSPVGITIDLMGGGDGTFNSNYFDMNAGVLLKSQMNDKMRIEVGASFNNILTPDYHLNEGATDTTTVTSQPNPDEDTWDLPGNFLMHGQFFVDLNDKWVAKPAFLFQAQSGANEIMIQGIAGYHLNEKKDMTLNFGVGYRLRDAAKFIVGMDYKQFRVGAAYDLTVSDLRDASSSAGGFELGVSYIAKIYKKPTVKPVIFCPRF